MSGSIIKLQLPESIRSAAERFAEEDGVSLDHWVASALAEKIDATRSAAEFLRARSANAHGDFMREVLSRAPDVPPIPGDELPDEWVSIRPTR